MKKIVSIALILLFVFSCSKEDTGSSSSKDNYNRKTMLTFWADDIIIPAYKDLSGKTAEMNAATMAFAKAPSQQTLLKVREQWKAAYLSWQKASLFKIGKAESPQINITTNLNTYPTDVNGIDTYAKKGEYNFESLNLKAVQGFPALDYLLNGVKSTDEEIIEFYKTDTNYVVYLKDVAKRVNQIAITVYNDWTNNNYREEFITNDGNTKTSSVNKLVNYYVVTFFEKQLRENKIVTPSGARPDESQFPEKVEAFYAKNISKELYTTALQATFDFYRGMAYDGKTTGQSLHQYLVFLKREKISESLTNNFKKAIEIAAKLEDNFYNQINDTEKRKVFLDSFDALQDVLHRFKPDMMSAMSIRNTSPDTDND